MTVLESTGVSGSSSQEPIKFPDNKDERREQRMRRRQERRNLQEQKPPVAEPEEPADKVFAAYDDGEDDQGRERRGRQRSRLRISWTMISFLIMVAVPSGIAGLYFAFFASPQYVVETQFSVRGSNQASMSSLGLAGLFGSSVQPGDSYIVSSYIESVQLIRDVRDQLGVDLRQYFSRNDIDALYRIEPNMPLEKFTDYWKDMIGVSFNATTGNTTLYVYAFSADDTKAIADAVLKVSETLVNNLSESNRQQMTLMASKQVERSEERLRKVRVQIRELRSKEKTIDPRELVKGGAELTQALEAQLQALKTRESTLLQSVAKDSPSARMLAKQIKSAEEALDAQRNKIGADMDGASSVDGPDRNVAEVVNRFEELTVEQGFATQAYTTALAAFETALSEAQKQERYFATFVAPTRPEIALYPMRMLDSFISFLVLLAVWMISQFLYRSFRDHAI